MKTWLGWKGYVKFYQSDTDMTKKQIKKQFKAVTEHNISEIGESSRWTGKKKRYEVLTATADQEESESYEDNKAEERVQLCGDSGGSGLTADKPATATKKKRKECVAISSSSEESSSMDEEGEEEEGGEGDESEEEAEDEEEEAEEAEDEEEESEESSGEPSPPPKKKPGTTKESKPPPIKAPSAAADLKPESREHVRPNRRHKLPRGSRLRGLGHVDESISGASPVPKVASLAICSIGMFHWAILDY